MTRAAVIGPRSMLGSAIIRRLKILNVDVVSVGRSLSDDIYMNLGEDPISELKAEGHVDTVFHCSSAFFDDSYLGLERNFKVNTLGALQTTFLAQKFGASAVIYAGSLSSDDSDPQNYTSYGLTKGLAEKTLNWGLEKAGVRFCSLRLSQLYDTKGLCCAHQPWFGRVIAYAARGLDLRLPQSLGPRNFLHVEDAADLMIAAGQREMNGIVNVVHPESLTMQQIAETAYAVFGSGGRCKVASEKTPFRSVNFSEYDGIFALHGVGAPRSMREGIEEIQRAETFMAFGPMDVE